MALTSEALDVIEFERRFADRLIRTTSDYPLPAGHIDEPAGGHVIAQEDISAADPHPVPDTKLDSNLLRSTASIIQRSHEYTRCNCEYYPIRYHYHDPNTVPPDQPNHIYTMAVIAVKNIMANEVLLVWVGNDFRMDTLNPDGTGFIEQTLQERTPRKPPGMARPYTIHAFPPTGPGPTNCVIYAGRTPGPNDLNINMERNI